MTEAGDPVAGQVPGRHAGLTAFVERCPKVELHVHLEGSFPPATLLELARKHRVSLPADDEAGVRRWFRFADFEEFVRVYLTCSACLREAEDFHRLALGFLAEQGRQNVVYSEAHFTISTHLASGGDGEAIRQALREAAEEGERRWGTRMTLIPDVVRNVGPAAADRTLEWALADPHRGSGRAGSVVALGLSGSEARFPATPFRPHFEAAGAAGLHLVAHAGEHAGPESVREVLELGAERIGHGVRSVEDPALVAELARRGVPLEVCPSSNVCLGVVPDLARHPFDRLRRAGVTVTVNSDDPPFFATTLSGEYLRLAATFGYGTEELARLLLAAPRCSFLPETEKAALEREVARHTAVGEGGCRRTVPAPYNGPP